MTTEELVRQLQAIRLLKTPVECLAFDGALWHLRERGDVGEHAAGLFAVFDDACEHHEVMWGLVHWIEQLPGGRYLEALVDALPSMQGSAKEWAGTLVARVLNHERLRPKFVARVAKAPAAVRKAALAVLDGLATNDGSIVAKRARAARTRIAGR